MHAYNVFLPFLHHIFFIPFHLDSPTPSNFMSFSLYICHLVHLTLLMVMQLWYYPQEHGQPTSDQKPKKNDSLHKSLTIHVGLDLMKSLRRHHYCCEFMSAVVVPCLENNTSNISPYTPAHILSILSCKVFPESHLQQFGWS